MEALLKLGQIFVYPFFHFTLDTDSRLIVPWYTIGWKYTPYFC